MFYDRFKEMCTKKGVSCNKAATEIGLSNSTATKWKKTGATPDAKTISKIAEYFGVTVDFLLTGEQKTPADPKISGREKEFMQLFGRLTPDQQDMILAQLRGVVGNQGK